MVSSLCQINLSTVAKQSLDCLFAEEGKHYTAMIGFSQQPNRQINANFTPHVYRTFSNQYFQSPLKRYPTYWAFFDILWWNTSNKITDLQNESQGQRAELWQIFQCQQISIFNIDKTRLHWNGTCGFYLSWLVTHCYTVLRHTTISKFQMVSLEVESPRLATPC